jgi:formamidopyrimidine-DNA glycosylase
MGGRQPPTLLNYRKEEAAFLPAHRAGYPAASIMIELPEAMTISRQMNGELTGKRIRTVVFGTTPHKFAFVNRSPEEYVSILESSVIGRSREQGSLILVDIEPDYALELGGGGERILFHKSEKTIPKKHQLLLEFDDGTYFTVTVQGWGSVKLLDKTKLSEKGYLRFDSYGPLEDGFTYAYFSGLFDDIDPDDPRSIKYFVISDPGIKGVANGCLQDVLFRAKIHPKRVVADIADWEREAIYEALKSVLKEMTDQGGRDSERDLYNNKGGYRRILDSRTKGKPCPVCGATIEKIQYLGGASYFCPVCQE